ncbi:MAG: phenylacetate--CoA ligase family protein [Sedimentisphaerales bacterium]
MNWRKPIVYCLLYASGSKIPQHLRSYKKYEHLGRGELKQLIDNKLRDLLVYAYHNVPYYNEILKQAGVVDNESIRLEGFTDIPVLTKLIIRQQGENLYSKEHKKRRSYKNTSGGSTGEPVTIIQDKNYSDRNIANTIYFKSFGGQDIGEKELRLWGSERDLMDKEKLSVRLKNWLFNRTELNAFKMSKEDMAQFVNKVNRVRPKWIESYVQAAAEFSRFIKENNLSIISPRGVLTSAGTLYPQMQQMIEDVFKCRVFNRYGSREVGSIACSCEKNEGLHVSVWNNYLEILDDNLRPVKPGGVGRIYVTNLNNYSMPLIRYQIGDIGVTAENPECSCGRKTPLIKGVMGRHMEVFRTKDGKIIPAEFFIHFIGVVYNEGYIRKFQVIQKDYDRIVIKAVVGDLQKFNEAKEKLVNSIRMVMGRDCVVEFELVDEIPFSASGKYLYTVSELKL